MNNIENKERPKCSCGERMVIIEYKGYYDRFNYWRCDKCSLDDEIQNINGDVQEKGSYA